jgi:hypothetical protein
MTYTYALTFESRLRQPVTVRGTVESPSPRSAGAKALRAAFRSAKGQRWDSFSLMLEKPLSTEVDGASEGQP